jgi:hypothetical protein
MRKYGERISSLCTDRGDKAVRVGAQQIVTREVEAPERNARPRRYFDVAMEDLALRFSAICLHCGKEVRER